MFEKFVKNVFQELKLNFPENIIPQLIELYHQWGFRNSNHQVGQRLNLRKSLHYGTLADKNQKTDDRIC